MMLIEHRKRLKELKESEEDRKKPVLDDQEKEEINYNLPVEIKYYEDKRFKTASGVIKKVNLNRKEVIISEKGDEQQKISINNLLDLRLK